MLLSQYFESALNIGTSFSKYFLKFAIIILVLLVGCIISRTIGKIVKKIFQPLKFNEVTTKTGQKISVGFISASTIEIIGYFITLIFAFNEIGLKKSTIDVILICLIITAFLAILNIALLGMNSFAPNLVAGISIFARNNIKKGNIIEIGEHKGEVVKMTLLEITLKNHKNEIIYVPNSRIFSNDVVIHKYNVLHHSIRNIIHPKK